jgi:hypothetical protein
MSHPNVEDIQFGLNFEDGWIVIESRYRFADFSARSAKEDGEL